MADLLERPTNPGHDDGRCGNDACGAAGLTDDDRCHGCGYTVCSDCDKNAPFGPHLVIEHWEQDGA